MTRTHLGRRALAGACALTLLFAACGGDDDSGSDDGSTEETTASTEAESTESTGAPDETTASEPEEDTTTSEGEGEGDPEAVATAEAINLKLEDFAEGWVEEAEATDGGDDIDECFTTVDIAGTTLGEAETPTFSAETGDGAGGQLVSMQTVVFDTPETATAVVAEVGTPEFATCIQGTIAEDGDAEASLTPLVDDPPLAEESAGVAGAVQISQEDGSTVPAQADLHVIRTGAVASFTITLNIGETPDSAFEQTLGELYTLIAQRQAEAA